MIITISGAEGSGKSTLAKKLEQELEFPRIYVGGIRRKIAAERGMTLATFNEWSETNPEGDVEVDQRVVSEVSHMKNAIVEGRVMFHFFPNSIKIFLDVDTDTAAKRIFGDLKKGNRNEDDNLTSTLAVKNSLLERRKSDKLRYKKYYNLDVFDHANYDLVIDTTNIPQEATFEKVISFITSHNEKQ